MAIKEAVSAAVKKTVLGKLLHRDRLGEVTGLVDIGPFYQRNIVR